MMNIKKNYNNALKGLQNGYIKIHQAEKGYLYCSVRKSKEGIDFGGYDNEELSEFYIEKLNKIISKKNVKIVDGQIICSVEDFYSKFRYEDIANLLAISIEACDCSCSFEHFSKLLEG
jgi:hypothetical protein